MADQRYDRLVPDDRLREVPRTWVGAGGYIFWWEARFTAYGVFAVALIVLEIVGFIFWPFTAFVMFLVAPGLAIGITKQIMRYVDYERPVLAVLRHFAVGLPRALAYKAGILGRPATSTSTVLTVRVNARRTPTAPKPLPDLIAALPLTHRKGAPRAQP